MRSEQEMMDLILDVAKADERIRAALLVGSRANPAVPKDCYQDYDIAYFVTDMKPFYNNPAWVEEKFGRPLIMQMPEAMRWPDGGGHFNYMMVYPDGNRLDLSFEVNVSNYMDDGEPAIILLDKDNGSGLIPHLPLPNDEIWHIKPPSPLFFYSCCNNFWWCLNNVAKGIARDELPYVMNMLNEVVRAELHYMMEWYIGVQHGFNLSVGKNGKYFKKYLPPELYSQYAATYSGSDYADIWSAIEVMCDLFHTLALTVALHFSFTYRQEEETGMREYLRMVKAVKPIHHDGALIDGIKTATESDLQYILDMDPFRRTNLILHAIKHCDCYIAVYDGIIKGFAIMNYTFFENGFIELLMVAEKFRKCGIGSALLNHLFAVCKTQKLFTSTNKSNKPMRNFLEKSGYTFCGEIDALDEGDPEMFFVKKKVV